MSEPMDRPSTSARDAFPERRGDWMQTYTGRRFWPLDPRRDDVCIEDIAHALSLQIRFGGHCLRFYSVAEHSVLLARWVLDHYDGNLQERRIIALWMLLHDGSEAYLTDMIRPVKRSMPEYRAIEVRVQDAVYERFGLIPLSEPDSVKQLDRRILMDERAQVMRPTEDQWHFGGETEPLGTTLAFWAPEQAEHAFLATFSAITGQDVAFPVLAALRGEAALAREVERLRAVCAERQSRIDALESDAAKRVQSIRLSIGTTEARKAIQAASDRLTGQNLLLTPGEADDEFTDRCIACNEVVQDGQLVLDDANGGLVHKACCGPEREAYTGADGEPLKPGEEIPAGWPYRTDRKAHANPADDESLDGTDGAHPAWWRGNDAGCMAVIGMVEEALAGKPMRGEPGEPRLGAILRHVGQLRAYLRAFVRVCYDERVTRGKEREEAVRAAGLFRVNPGMTFNFALNDTDMREVPLITGGQVLRAMELLGEVDELTPAEEANNLVASAVLRNVQWYVGLAAQRMAAMSEEDRTKHDMLGVNVHLQNMVTAIGAVAPGKAVPIDAQIAEALQEVRACLDSMPETEGYVGSVVSADAIRAIVRLADLIVPPAGES